MPSEQNERTPLLHNGNDSADAHGSDEVDVVTVDFTEKDAENPRNWSKSRKYLNLAVIAGMAVLSPLASSMFTPGIAQIAEDLNSRPATVVGAATGYVVCLGIGPLLLAPLSETFGRRNLYLVCFSIFTITQIPTALARNVVELIAWRTVSGFFGSVSIANGGGSISDMFYPQERAQKLGIYSMAPLLGPTLAPLLGSVLVANLGWRWIFWVLAIISGFNTIVGFVFLKETYAPAILERRRKALQGSEDGGKVYRCANQDDRDFKTKLGESMLRPLRILFTHPVVFILATYQALLFGTAYSLYTNFEAIYSTIYNFTTTQVGLVYLSPGLGFLVGVWFLVPQIDTIYNRLTEKNKGESQPEFRLPIANIGAVLLPVSLFAFAWTIQYEVHFMVPIICTFFFGIAMVCILNTATNYFIDAFSKYAASAIAAGAVFRSIIGGVLPLGATKLFQSSLEYGWGISVFAACGVILSPVPLLFFYYGARIRERFAIDL